MKRLISILALISSINVWAQAETPVKGNNVIYIHCDSSAEYNFDDFGKHLISKGFSFETIDRGFMLLTTHNKTSQGAFQHQLVVSFRDSIIQIKARCNILMLGSSITNPNFTTVDWEYYPSKGHTMNTHYRAFIDVIQSYNKPITYDSL